MKRVRDNGPSGSTIFSGLGREALALGAVANGNPQCGQAAALSETEALHSGHWMSTIEWARSRMF